MSNHLPVFVISLASSADRRKRMSERLNHLSFNFRFLDGVDLRGQSITEHPSYDSPRRRLYFGRDLEAAELGCLLAHRNAYQAMVDESLPHALILEDDVDLASDLPAVIEALVDSPIEWDIIRFLDKKKVYRKRCRKIGVIENKYELARLPTNSGGAYGYLINQNAAQRLLTLTEKNWLQIDVLHSQTWRTNLCAYILRKSPVIHQDDEPSIIGASRFEVGKGDSSFRSQIKYRVMRCLMRYQDIFMKRYYFHFPARWTDALNRRKLLKWQEND